MEYTTEKIKAKSQVAFTFTFGEKEWNDGINKAYEKNKNDYTAQGFRKGKVPRKMLEQQYGKGIFYEDAINILLSDAYPKALDENPDVTVVAAPEVDVTDISDKSLVAKVTVTVKPEFELGQYKGLVLPKIFREVQAKDIEEELNKAREKSARLIEVTDRAAENGDTVNIDYSGSIDDVKFEGGTAEKQNLELGSKSFIEGFEEQLIGAKTGDEKDITVRFPDNYGAAHLAGKEAVFHIKVNSISRKELPELNDEFANDVSGLPTLEEYKKDIAEKLQKSLDKNSEEEMENQLIDLIAANTKIDIPSAMLEQEISDMLRQFEHRLMYQGMKMDEYLNYTGIKIEDIRKDYKESAEKNVKVRLIFDQIVEKEGLTVSDGELEEKISEMANSVKQNVKDFKKNMQKHHYAHYKNELLMMKLFKKLKEENKFE